MLAALVCGPRMAHAGDTAEAAKKRASYRYVHMTAEEALAELDRIRKETWNAA